MTLRSRVVTVPLIDGIGDNDDDFASDPPSMATLDEARWGHEKQIGKRFGVTIVCEAGDGKAITAAVDPNQVVDLDGIGHVVTGSGTFRQNPYDGTFAAMNFGAPRPSRVVSNPAVRVNDTCVKSDAAVLGDVMCVVWEQISRGGSGAVDGAYYAFFDVSQDVPRPISGPTKFTTIMNSVRVVAVRSNGVGCFVFAGLSAVAAGTMYTTAYSLNAGTWTVAAEVSTGDVVAAGGNHYGLCSSYDGSYACLAYLKNTPARAIKKLDAIGTVVATRVGSNNGVQHVLHNGPLSKIVVISADGQIDHTPDTFAGAVTSVASPFTNPASGYYTGKFFRASIGLCDVTGAMWAARSSSGPYSRAGNNGVITQTLRLSTVFAVTHSNTIGGVVLGAHFSPLISDGFGHVGSYLGVCMNGAWVTADATVPITPGAPDSGDTAYVAEPVGYLVKLVVSPSFQMVPCARYGQDAMELFGNQGVGTAQLGTATSHLPHLACDTFSAVAAQTKRIVTAYPTRAVDFLGGSPGSYKRQVDMARIDMVTMPPTQNASAQSIRILGGGNGATMIDGVDHAELTPPAPEYLLIDGYDMTDFGNGVSHRNTTGGPYPSPSPQWSFKVLWQYVDARGNVHRGAPSSTFTANDAGMNDNAGHCGKLCFPPWTPTALLGDKPIAAQACIYACPYDGNGDFRLMGIVTPNPDAVDEGRVYVNINVGGQHYSYGVDLNTWDSVQPVPRSLYTTSFGGGKLPSRPPPPLLSLCSTQSRLWGLNAEDRLDVWYTKPIELGFAPEFSDTLRVRVPQDGGPAVGIAAIDDKVIVFKRTKVFVIDGDPGDAGGNNSTLRPPRLVSSDIGCDAVESIVEGPFGVIFHSDRGFFTLDRGLSYNFVGDKVMDQLNPASSDGLTRVVTSGCIIPSEAEVRYTADTVRGAGNIHGLAWNYRLNRWTRRDSLARQASVAVGGVEWIVFPDPSTGETTIYRETPFNWSVNPSKLSFRTSWIKLNGIAGYGRVWRAVFLLRYYNHDINVTTFVDYSATGDSTRSFLQASLSTLADSSGRLELVIQPTTQKCEAIQFLVSEDVKNTDVNVGRGFELIGVTLELGVKPTAFKKNAAAARG